MSHTNVPPHSAPPPARHGGSILADQLALLGVQKVFCVPGESFLALLDGLHDQRDTIDVITCRHEAGASNMADAYAKLTGKPGICAVTRGPGATNASNGIHTAFQDSTPLILLIGQVSRDARDREAFQEIDYSKMFGDMAKWVAQIDDVRRIPECISRAWHVAQAGRPGPVVLALPEDVLSDLAEIPDLRPQPVTKASPTVEAIMELGALIEKAERPLLVVGGPSWSAQCAREAMDFASRTGLPVATSFRCQDYVDNRHENYVGVIGIGPIPELRQRIMEDVDLLIGVGPRFGEMTTQGYSLLDIPNPQMRFVHVHPGADELNTVYAADLAITSTPDTFWQATHAIGNGNGVTKWAQWRAQQRSDYEAFSVPVDGPGRLNMSEIVGHLSTTLPDDAIFANGAGNNTGWVHRFHQYRGYRTQLAPTSGSMGYGVPAAIAASLAEPDRAVVCISGDGCFLMTAQELATAKKYATKVIFMVVNNSMYGTIRMHQERHFPGRIIATELTNPDFVAYANAFGIAAEKVETTDAFPAALQRARDSNTNYLIELIVDPEALTPTQTLSEARAQGEAQLY